MGKESKPSTGEQQQHSENADEQKYRKAAVIVFGCLGNDQFLAGPLSNGVLRFARCP